MESQLSNRVITMAAVTASGSHYFLSDREHELYKRMGHQDILELPDKTTVKKSAIMEVMTLEKFYNLHPEHRPKPEYPRGPGEDGHSWEEIKKMAGQGFNGLFAQVKHLRGMKALGRGLQKVVKKIQAEGGKPTESLFLLQKAAKRVKELSLASEANSAPQGKTPQEQGTG